MDQWKGTFLDKLNQAQAHWVKRFEDALDNNFLPVCDDYKTFLADNGFRFSVPLREPGRRSFKFELAENAYVLMIFRSAGVGEFELHVESFVPGSEPVLTKLTTRVTDLVESWSTQQLRAGLDGFVDLLAGSTKSEPVEELVGV